jgi:gluconate 2-dehydrogenase gamma chain
MTHDDRVPERRDFLMRVLGAMTVAGLSGSTPGSLLPNVARAHAATPATEVYKPTYFTDAEWRFLNAAVDRLIPSNDDGPSGLELHVPEFIDRQMGTEYGHGGMWYLQGPFDPDADFTLGYQQRYSPRDFYRAAIPGIDSWCTEKHGKIFSELDAPTQDATLAALEKGEIQLPGMKASEFFLQLLANTKEGYFADPMYGGNLHMGSWKMIGFPGARADFKDWVVQYGKVYPLGPVSIMGEKA